MNDNEIQNYLKQVGGREVYLTEDPTGEYRYDNKRYTITDSESNIKAIVFDDADGGVTRNGIIYIIVRQTPLV